MKFLDLPTEILKLICYLLVVKNTGTHRCVYINTTVCLKYTSDPDERHICDRLERTFYNGNMQLLQVCRQLYDMSVPIIYGEHRFACHQPASFMESFAGQISESNLRIIAKLYLREPEDCRRPGDEESRKLVRFLVHRIPGLKSFELSKRWHTDLDGLSPFECQFRDNVQRATMQWIVQELLQRHQQLRHAS